MKTSFLYSLLALMATLIMAGSCSTSTDDSYTYTSNCAIKSFTLGKLKRKIDSTSVISFNGSLYPLTIDQVGGRIYNSEAFPAGTILRTLATISADGLVAYASESDTSATKWKAYSASDSIDFSEPLVFRVYAYDNSGYRDYYMSLSVRTENSGEYTWEPLNAISGMAQRAEAQMLLQNDEVVVLSRTADGLATYCARSAITDSLVWNEQVCTGLSSVPDVRHAVCYQGQLWMNTDEGRLLCSANGVQWTDVPQASENDRVQLIAASQTALYAIITSISPEEMRMPNVVCSTDGVTWTTMKTEAGLNTSRPLTSVAYLQSNGNRRVLLCTDATDGDKTFLNTWGFLETEDERWILITDDNVSENQLPRWQHPILLEYNEWLVALGDQDLAGTHAALDAIYVSYDYGQNWFTGSDLVVPSELRGMTAPIAAVTVGEYIWLMAGNQLQRVRYNDYGQ